MPLFAESGLEAKAEYIWARLSKRLGAPPTKAQFIDFWIEVGGGDREVVTQFGSNMEDPMTLMALQGALARSEAALGQTKA
eukprot:SAG11_NODE_33249_length_278_cov_0.860335_1_plen_80_part_10